jgi:IclR family acetate operon transcriptional repressor
MRGVKAAGSAAKPEPAVPAYAVESVDSALKILRMLCDSKDLRVSQVAERLGVAQSTAHRLLSMLVHHGFAVQDGRGREYRTGPMLLEMGFASIRDMDVRQHARPILEELRDKVNETVHLGVPYGQEVLYVEAVESRHQLRIASRVGAFLPAHCVGLGKALLATLSPDELHHLYPGDELRTLTDRSLKTRAELERQLEKIRRQGYAKSRGESDEGVGSLAVAVLDRRGVARAAISISAPVTRISPDLGPVWIEAVNVAADKLRTRLWGRPETV